MTTEYNVRAAIELDGTLHEVPGATASRRYLNSWIIRWIHGVPGFEGNYVNSEYCISDEEMESRVTNGFVFRVGGAGANYDLLKAFKQMTSAEHARS